MSLINDYLKKSRAAKEDQSPALAGVPPVMKQPKGGGDTTPKEKKVSLKTVVLLVIVILVGIVGYYLTMPPPTSSPQHHPDPAVPVEEELVKPAAPRVKEVPLRARSGPKPQTKTEVYEKNNVVGERDKRELRPVVSPSSIQEKELAEPAKKVAPVISPKPEPNPTILTSATDSQTVAYEEGEPENITSDPAAVNIRTVPLSYERAGQGFKKTAGARVRRPNRKDDLDHLFQVGVLALNSGNRSRALYYFNQVLDLDSKHQDTLLNLAVISLEQNDFEKAGKLLEKAGNNDPHDARVKVNQGLIALKCDNYDRAQKLFADALLLDPGSTSALNNLAWLAQHQGDKAAALLYYRNLVALDPQNLKALLAYASYCEREKDLSQALQCYQDALQSRFLENNQSLERRIRERIKLLSDYVD